MDAQKVIVYVRADDVRMLKEQEKDPAEFVRGLIRRALDRMKEQTSE
jgi:hypothetical protein